jgi:hypothetical protein
MYARGHCRGAAKRVATEIPGAELCAGLFRGRPHVWNVLWGGLFYADISASQYGLPAVLLKPKEEALNLGYIPSRRLTQIALEDAERLMQAEMFDRMIEDIDRGIFRE